MVAPPEHRTAEHLTDLPSDLLRNIYCALANPLAPAAACYFASTCHDVRSAALARAASATFSEAQHLQCFWARATALCKSKRMTRSLLSRATQFTAGPVISGECFSAADAEIFGQLLGARSITRLHMLVLEQNQLGEEGMRPIVQALADGALPMLRDLQLYENGLGDGFCAALAAALACPARVLPALAILNLSRNRVTSQGVAALAAALSRGALPHLTTLDLSDNDIDSAGIEALAETGRQGLRALETLYIQGQSGGSAASLEALAGALENGAFPALRELWPPGHWQHPSAARLATACAARGITRGVGCV